MGVELIAEVSSNHGGDLVLAKEFIHAFAEAGADWVKFQTTRVKHLNPTDPQYAWFARAELSDDAHFELKAECEKANVGFLTTVYNAAESFLADHLRLSTIKLGSGEQANDGLRAWAERNFTRVLRSVNIAHVDQYRSYYDARGEALICVTRYPASERACLAAIQYIGRHGVVGYSDHSIGLEMARWAMDCGARIVEKHVCLPSQARQARPFEASVADFKGLRQYANEGPQRFIGRWQYA